MVGRCDDSILSRDGMGHASTLQWVSLGAVIEKDMPLSPQSPSDCCNPCLVLFSAPDWHPVSPSSVPCHEIVPPENSFRPIIYHIIPRHRNNLKFSGPLIACPLEVALGRRPVKTGTIDMSEIAAVCWL